MPLSAKLKADYVELINQSLDALPFEALADFNAAQTALEHLLNPQSIYNPPESFQEHIAALGQYLNEPELFVSDRADDAEFKQLVQMRIGHKITELHALTEDEKQAKIQAQLAHKERVVQTHQLMSERRERAVVSVLSEEGWLRDEQEREIASELGVSQEILTRLSKYALCQLAKPEMVRALCERRFTLDELILLDSEASEVGMSAELFNYLSQDIVHALIKKEITLESFIAIHHAADAAGMSGTAKAYLSTLECVKAILKRIYTVERLARLFAQAEEAGMSPQLRWNLIKPHFVAALEHHEFTVASMAQAEQEALNEEMRRVLFVRPDCFKALYKNLFTVSDLAHQSPNFIREFFHANCIKAIERGDVDLEHLMELSLDELHNANISDQYPGNARRMVR